MKKMFVLVFLIITGLFFFGCEIDPNTVFKVIYHGNGSDYGFPPMDVNEYKSGMEAVVLGENTLSKTGYTFQGWNTKADGSGDSYNAGDKIEIIKLNRFLYAVWVKDE